MAEDLQIPESGKIDNKLLLSMLRDIRRDQRETKELLLALTKHVFDVEKRLVKRIDDVNKRIDDMNKRFDEVKDDLEIMLKSELLGRLTNFETRIDRKIEELLTQ